MDVDQRLEIDWTAGEFAFLKSRLLAGEVALFAGAGFSFDTKNVNGKRPPLGSDLAKLLCDRASQPYEDDPLSIVYEAMTELIGEADLWAFLKEQFSITQTADWYKVFSSITWNRLYTINIDNLFEKLIPYVSGQQLDLYVRGDPVRERDPHFDKLQCIHLHGHIAHRANGLTFTLPDFAEHTATLDPWYQTLVQDLATRPVIFIGTTLEEQQIFHYMHLRGVREKGHQEIRPKSFFVSPNVSAIRARALRKYNIFAVRSTAAQFFKSMAGAIDLNDLTKESVKSRVWPHLFKKGISLRRDVTEHFTPIVPSCLPEGKHVGPSRFFYGAEPSWRDINESRDAPLSISRKLLDVILSETKAFRCVSLTGPAGSGKSTTLMRTAVRVAAQGCNVFFALGYERTDFTGLLDLSKKSDDDNQRIVVFVDNISKQLPSLSGVLRDLQSYQNLTLVVGDQTNRYATKCHAIDQLDPIAVSMPNLVEQDVIQIIKKLTQFGCLGKLRGKSQSEQIADFMQRAGRQLLVALREATSGEEFHHILENEFFELDRSAQLAYTIAAIAVSRGAVGVYRQNLSPCIPKSNFAKGVVLNDILKEVLIEANESGTMLKPRHNVIAKLIANEVAPDATKYEAVTAFLKHVSKSIDPKSIKRRSPQYIAYRGMINASGLQQLFSGEKNESARTLVLNIYEELVDYYQHDYLFWLQYGIANENAGVYDVAENCLHQSLSMNEHSQQALHHLAVIYLIQAAKATNPVAMKEKAEKGIEILADQMQTVGDEDSYPYHSYLVHVTRWYLRLGDAVVQDDWDKLIVIGKTALSKYRIDDKIRDAVNELDRQFLLRSARITNRSEKT